MVKAKASRVFASSFFFLLVVLCRRHAHSHTFSSHYKHAHHRETARLGTTVGLGFACCCWLAVSPLPLPAAHTPKSVPTVFFLSVSRPVVAAAKDEEKKTSDSGSFSRRTKRRALFRAESNTINRTAIGTERGQPWATFSDQRRSVFSTGNR